MADLHRKMSSEAATKAVQPLVMQIVVERELTKPVPEGGWPRGPLMASAAHAAIAIIARTASTAATQAYTSPEVLNDMHKVVLVTPSNLTLRQLSEKLTAVREANAASPQATEPDLEVRVPEHHLWIEMPEGIPSCLAVAPNRRPCALKKVLKSCSLLRN